MSDELDRRAAKAVGWTQIAEEPWFWVDRNGMSVGIGIDEDSWSPSTDRNDLAELLREVERRGLALDMVDKAVDAWMKNDTHDNTDMCMFWFLVADPAVICLAAVEVLEAANE